MSTLITSSCLVSKKTANPWLSKAPPTTGAISTTWVGSFRAKSRPVNSARLLGGSKPPVFQSSRPWMASVGTGQKKINRLQIQDLFRLSFIQEKANVIFLGLVGLGKTHLATALGYAACQHGYSVLFANAIDVINTLSAAQTKGVLKSELKRYLSPALLLLDEIGYLPIDQRG